MTKIVLISCRELTLLFISLKTCGLLATVGILTWQLLAVIYSQTSATEKSWLVSKSVSANSKVYDFDFLQCIEGAHDGVNIGGELLRLFEEWDMTERLGHCEFLWFVRFATDVEDFTGSADNASNNDTALRFLRFSLTNEPSPFWHGSSNIYQHSCT